LFFPLLDVIVLNLIEFHFHVEKTTRKELSELEPALNTGRMGAVVRTPHIMLECEVLLDLCNPEVVIPTLLVSGGRISFDKLLCFAWLLAVLLRCL
jgi:hypothetical protein